MMNYAFTKYENVGFSISVAYALRIWPENLVVNL